MIHYSATQWLFYFILYCFLGWVFESTYSSIHNRKLTNRGFIKGPFLPLYGTGALMLMFVSIPFGDNLFLLYIAGCVAATILEYFTAILMEAFFGMRYWDYTDYKIQYKGIISLKSSLAWGVLTLVLTKVIHPVVEAGTIQIPEELMKYIICVVLFAIAIDFAMSFHRALNLRKMFEMLHKTKEEMAKLKEKLESLLSGAGEDLAESRTAMVDNVRGMLEEADKKRGALTEKVFSAMKLVVHANPRVKSDDFAEFQEMKEQIDKEDHLESESK